MDEKPVAIRFSNLKKRYGNVRALDGLSLNVRRGEIFGLIGPDGSGKTTAMRIGCGLVVPDAGSAEVAGFDCVRRSRAVKEHLGYMPQRFSLYPDLTVSENLRFFADMFEVSTAERVTRQAELMQFSGLGPFLSRRAGALSGGMKQKLALCCTLIHTPDVLILDEPTTGVDVVSRREFWNILRELASDGLALLVSTPYMDEAMLFDRVVLMHRGRSIADGTPRAVTECFERRLLEITGPGIQEARQRLLDADLPAVEVHRFGNRLHVVHDSEEQEATIARHLADINVGLAPIRPDIEDAFVGLIGAAREASG